MRAGRAFTYLLPFSSGFPDDNITWSVSDTASNVLASGNLTPSAGAVSAVLIVDASSNVLASGNLTDGRELSWSYVSGGMALGGEIRYTIEAPIPFGVTPQGVRDKLGVMADELPDDAIPLMDAYLEYREAQRIDSFQDGTSRERRLIINALEALAGIQVITTLQVRLAAKESSGTNTFDRSAKIDWDMLISQLRSYIAAASVEFGTASTGGLLVLAGPTTDPITGA